MKTQTDDEKFIEWLRDFLAFRFQKLKETGERRLQAYLRVHGKGLDDQIKRGLAYAENGGRAIEVQFISDAIEHHLARTQKDSGDDTDV